MRADAVIDASGTWGTPNPAGANGARCHRGDGARSTDRLWHARRLRCRARPLCRQGRWPFLGPAIRLSAPSSIWRSLKQAEPQTQIVWLLRGDNPEKSFGGGANDKLAARGELGKVFAELVQAGGVRVEAGFRLTHINANGEKLRLGAGSDCCGRQVEVDELIVATGFRPDLSFLRELRISLDPALECPPILAPLIDPNLHSCGTVRPHGARELAQPEAGFYFAGMKSYGRAPTFLMMTGYEQVRSIIADIAGDKEAAERVELVLPETGVCSRPLTASSDERGVLRRTSARQCRRLLPSRMLMPKQRVPRVAAAPDGHRLLFRFCLAVRFHRGHADGRSCAAGAMAPVPVRCCLQDLWPVATGASTQAEIRDRSGRAAHGAAYRTRAEGACGLSRACAAAGTGVLLDRATGASQGRRVRQGRLPQILAGRLRHQRCRGGC